MIVNLDFRRYLPSSQNVETGLMGLTILELRCPKRSQTRANSKKGKAPVTLQE